MRRPVVSLVASAGLLLVLGSFTFSLNLGYANLATCRRAPTASGRSTSSRTRVPRRRLPAGHDRRRGGRCHHAGGAARHRRPARHARQPMPSFGAATIVTSEAQRPGAHRCRADRRRRERAGDRRGQAAARRVHPADLRRHRRRGARHRRDGLRRSTIVNLADDLPADRRRASSWRSASCCCCVAFRSIVVPIKAIVMNLLSVFAAYGLLVLVFQKGVGAELLGFQQVDADRRLRPALPLLHPVRPLDGLPRLPAEPHQGAVRPHRRQRAGGRHRAALAPAG